MFRERFCALKENLAVRCGFAAGGESCNNEQRFAKLKTLPIAFSIRVTIHDSDNKLRSIFMSDLKGRSTRWREINVLC